MTTAMDSSKIKDNFITVVAVGNEVISSETPPDEYITVLTIGDHQENSSSKDITEEVLVYRLPGERLGFGLKFEGGTKANEFVKRLFIQSCAPDSPASRVESSWGNLAEGDEVLEIDCMPVNTMTRIDCVRCLKDSNVVIKLLVKHFNEPEDDSKSRSTEGLPQVISAEKKRSPPPPPPVPPRKIPKKSCKNLQQINSSQENTNPVPAARQINDTMKKFQSPRSSGRVSQSPRRDRRFSDGSLGPPDAEIYVDLFLQESVQSLSESDETGSSISTVVDKFGSFPTTTTSSLAGSLPSTPTSIQKQLDFTNLLNPYEDDDFSNSLNVTIKPCNGIHKTEDITLKNEDGTPLQPPSCFQDAPLSYGNEDMRLETKSNEVLKVIYKKPPVPPRSNVKSNKINGCKDIHDENMNISNLPRLVDFVPKTANRDNFEINNLFLENERQDNSYFKNNLYRDDDIDAGLEAYSNDIDVYSSKWSLSHLATIGEDEEEGSQDLNTNRSPINATPIVIVENADQIAANEETGQKASTDEDINGKMETLPSDSRQPPDGHEFPDYIESSDTYPNLYKEDLRVKSVQLSENIHVNHNRSSFSEFEIKTPFVKTNSISNSDLSSIHLTDPYDSGGEKVTLRQSNLKPALHVRSQSLTDMSTINKQKSDRWSSLVEQRRKGFSKLKGLVIPEHVPESEPAPAVNIPEIISHTASTFVPETKTNVNETIQCHSNEIESTAIIITSPPWTTTSSTFPKYSPAFKRKSLQIYPSKKFEVSLPSAINKLPIDSKSCAKINSDELRLDNLSDSPKSLESITSPTRSDCSFDYITTNKKPQLTKPYNNIQKLHKDIGKSEDESDNDSAVSSSQSSYISRCSPPLSPSRSCEALDYDSNNHIKSDSLPYNRLLKPSSVEAINRKNILASAKCRSGRDLKVGSPIIQRKLEEDNSSSTLEKSIKPIGKDFKTIDVHSRQESKQTKLQPSRIFSTQLRETKVSPRTNYSKTNSLLNGNKSMSVTDIRKGFELFGSAPPPLPQKIPLVTSKEKIIVKPSIPENFPQKLQKFSAEITKPKPSNTPVVNNKITSRENTRRNVTLCPEFPGGSIGITLAGGTDYETKEITVHKIRYGSVAYHNGNVKRGDRVISINGKDTTDLTHAESVEMLKEAVMKFDFVLEDGKEENDPTTPPRRSFSYETLEPKSPSLPLPDKSATHVIIIVKDGAGLGFSIEGGKDSLEGDLPLKVKKIFQGGAADKCGELKVGDELLAINDVNVRNLSRIETWSLMKKLPDGSISIHIHR